MFSPAVVHTFPLAHPGHGTVPASSPMHYVVEPIHAFWIVVIAAALGGAVLYFRRQLLRRRTSRVAVQEMPRRQSRSR
ncbi:hypothetical protein SH661x_002389 [Planctomicrobium sp. SH661]|uniref:hypothetical protein n=1 Tax=Planctomicrobium sp. SH661 TaxID=3448124 RepID=UPI003F5C7C4D